MQGLFGRVKKYLSRNKIAPQSEFAIATTGVGASSLMPESAKSVSFNVAVPPAVAGAGVADMTPCFRSGSASSEDESEVEEALKVSRTGIEVIAASGVKLADSEEMLRINLKTIPLSDKPRTDLEGKFAYSYGGDIKAFMASADIKKASEICEASGETMLHWAARNNFVQALEFFNPAWVREQVNKLSKDGSTALIVAARQGSFNVVNYLLNIPGIDTNIKDQYGFTAIKYADQKINRLNLRMNAPDYLPDANDRDHYGHALDAYKLLRQKQSPSLLPITARAYAVVRTLSVEEIKARLAAMKAKEDAKRAAVFASHRDEYECDSESHGSFSPLPR